MAKQSNITTLLIIGGALLLLTKKNSVAGIGKVTIKELKEAGDIEHLQRAINFAGIILKEYPDTVLYAYDNMYHFIYNSGRGNAKINFDKYGERDKKMAAYYFLREYKGPVIYNSPFALVKKFTPAKPKKLRYRNEELHRQFDEQINKY